YGTSVLRWRGGGGNGHPPGVTVRDVGVISPRSARVSVALPGGAALRRRDLGRLNAQVEARSPGWDDAGSPSDRIASPTWPLHRRPRRPPPPSSTAVVRGGCPREPQRPSCGHHARV